MRPAARSTASLVLGILLAPSCRTPTEITLVMSTDVKCTDLRGTSVTVGRLGEIETKAPTTSSTFCDPSGDLGALVVMPSGGKSDEVAMKIIAGVARDADSCVPPYGKGCIVARRAIHYLPHTPLRISVPLRAVCDGVACADTQTCVSGQCVGAEIADPSACAHGGGCDEGVFGTVTVDAGADAADAAGDSGVAPTTYNDMTQAANWSMFDTRTVVPFSPGYFGAAFDGRYVYFAPAVSSNGPVNVPRYDTQGSLDAPGSWSAFDTKTLSPNADAYIGALFDGRYIHFVPNGDNGQTLVTRYDVSAPFTAAPSWSTFDTATVNANATGFVGATFDGRYVYFAPGNNGTATRYDTQVAFAAPAWSTFDATTLTKNAQGYWGAVFDGRYVYYVPFENFVSNPNGGPNGIVLRYDTQASFTAGTAWSTFDATPLGSPFDGAAFDGRYVYFAPYVDGFIVRYDTQAPFGSIGSWSRFDTLSTLKVQGFTGAVFDGRYVYFVPDGSDPTPGGVARYDTQGSFTAAGSWTTFDLTTVNASLFRAQLGFAGAVFDGRYVYLVPYDGTIVARFDAKSPPSMPKLPGFFGSFL